jgi:hypothetical protein
MNSSPIPPNRAPLIGFGFIAAMAVFALLIAGLTVNSTQPIRTQGSAFLDGIVAESYENSFELLSAEMREQLTSPDRLESYIVGGNHEIASYQITSTSIDGNRGAVVGTAVFEVDGGERPVFLSLERDGEIGWRIYSVQFNALSMNDIANDLEAAAQATDNARLLLNDEVPTSQWVLRRQS